MRFPVALLGVFAAACTPAHLADVPPDELFADLAFEQLDSGVADIQVTLSRPGKACLVLPGIRGTLDGEPMTTTQEPTFTREKGSGYRCSNSRLGLCKQESYETSTCLPAVFSGTAQAPAAGGTHHVVLSDGSRDIKVSFGLARDALKPLALPAPRDRLEVGFASEASLRRVAPTADLSVGALPIRVEGGTVSGSEWSVPLSPAQTAGTGGTLTIQWFVLQPLIVEGAQRPSVLAFSTGEQFTDSHGIRFFVELPIRF